MDQITVVPKVSSTDTPQTPKTAKKTSLLEKVVREIVAISFWAYALVKVFIIDLDVLIFSIIAPQHLYLLDYKFFFLVGAVAILWLLTRNSKIAIWFFYILFYPLIVVCWKIPVFIFKQKNWVFAIAVVNAIISFVKSIKHIYISGSIFLISFILVLKISSPELLWPAISFTLAILILIIVYEFISVFKPSNVFQMYKKAFSSIRTSAFGKSLYSLDQNIKLLPVDTLTDEQSLKRLSSLQNSILFNRVCLFGAKRLRDYQNSSIGILSFLLTILILILLSMMSFATINYGLFKIDASLFSISGVPTYFSFFYYSFNKLLFTSISEITAIRPLSQIASMIEQAVSFLIVSIFISSLFSVRSKRASDELNSVIKEIEKEGEEMEGFIRVEFNLNTISEAIKELERLKAGLISLIYWLSKN